MKFIINADDFGISNKFDDAIIDLIKKKKIFSVSVIIRNNLSYKKFEKIVKYKDKVSIGLHFEHNHNTTKDDEYKIIKKKLEEQYILFKEIFGIKPTHLDKHNREKSENETRVMCDFAIRENIPLRLYTRGKFFHIYEKEYKGKIKITNYLYNIGSKKYGIKKIKEDIKNPEYKNGIYEVISHPGFFDKDYDSKKGGSGLNRKRIGEYIKILELNKFLKDKKISISSFYEVNNYISKNLINLTE